MKAYWEPIVVNGKWLIRIASANLKTVLGRSYRGTSRDRVVLLAHLKDTRCPAVEGESFHDNDGNWFVPMSFKGSGTEFVREQLSKVGTDVLLPPLRPSEEDTLSPAYSFPGGDPVGETIDVGSGGAASLGLKDKVSSFFPKKKTSSKPKK